LPDFPFDGGEIDGARVHLGTLLEDTLVDASGCKKSFGIPFLFSTYTKSSPIPRFYPLLGRQFKRECSGINVASFQTGMKKQYFILCSAVLESETFFSLEKK
jgi:hypothetical protein